MNTVLPIHPERLSTTITRFHNWVDIGYKIHVEVDGTWNGDLERAKT